MNFEQMASNAESNLGLECCGLASITGRVGFLPRQKVFLPEQWKKPAITSNNWQKV